MCNENVNENAQIRPVCDAKIEADIANKRKEYWLKMPKSARIWRLANENV